MPLPARNIADVDQATAAIVTLGERVIAAFEVLDLALAIDPTAMTPELAREAMQTAASIFASIGPSIRTISAFVAAHSGIDQRPTNARTLNS